MIDNQQVRTYYHSFMEWMNYWHPMQHQMMQTFGTNRATIEPRMREWAQDITSTNNTK